jgi:hypothetical protein
MNLSHPCIAAPIGFIFASGSRELKILGLHSESEVIAASRMWWTPTMKAKAVAGLGLGLRFAHSLEFIHSCLTMKSVFLNWNHNIEIIDFLRFCQASQIEAFQRKDGILKRMSADLCRFFLRAFFWGPGGDKAAVSAYVPPFVSEMIEDGLANESERLSSFLDICKTVKGHEFEIVAGVDSGEVLIFVGWIQFLEQAMSQPATTVSDGCGSVLKGGEE